MFFLNNSYEKFLCRRFSQCDFSPSNCNLLTSHSGDCSHHSKKGTPYVQEQVKDRRW